jgi:hypothetical protein
MSPLLLTVVLLVALTRALTYIDDTDASIAYFPPGRWNISAPEEYGIVALDLAKCYNGTGWVHASYL